MVNLSSTRTPRSLSAERETAETPSSQPQLPAPARPTCGRAKGQPSPCPGPPAQDSSALIDGRLRQHPALVCLVQVELSLPGTGMGTGTMVGERRTLRSRTGRARQCWARLNVSSPRALSIRTQHRYSGKKTPQNNQIIEVSPPKCVLTGA